MFFLTVIPELPSYSIIQTLTTDIENCMCSVSTGLETVSSVMLMKIHRVNPCLADCTVYFYLKAFTFLVQQELVLYFNI